MKSDESSNHSAFPRLAPETLVVRTAWLYARHGRNIVDAMLQPMYRSGAAWSVDEQIGTPAFADSLAEGGGG